eukprot:1140995-Pelagomonas_calceolata.AAC.2
MEHCHMQRDLRSNQKLGNGTLLFGMELKRKLCHLQRVLGSNKKIRYKTLLFGAKLELGTLLCETQSKNGTLLFAVCPEEWLKLRGRFKAKAQPGMARVRVLTMGGKGREGSPKRKAFTISLRSHSGCPPHEPEAGMDGRSTHGSTAAF